MENFHVFGVNWKNSSIPFTYLPIRMNFTAQITPTQCIECKVTDSNKWFECIGKRDEFHSTVKYWYLAPGLPGSLLAKRSTKELFFYENLKCFKVRRNWSYFTTLL